MPLSIYCNDFSGLNQAGTMFVAKIKHPAGDIAQLLIMNGLARCADWMSPLLGGEGMQKLRDAERYTDIQNVSLTVDKRRHGN